MLGYGGAKGYNDTKIPKYMVAYAMDVIRKTKTNDSINDIVEDRCKYADIAEADVYYNHRSNSITSESYWFHYFDGIYGNYMMTWRDPYYNNEVRPKKRMAVNDEYIMLKWLGKML